MSDEDMIRRGDAIVKIKKAASGKSSSGLVLTVDAGVEALREIPAAQPSPDVAALAEALQPFSDCADELDYDTKETGREYPDDEWAKFRLLVSDYRSARAALARVKGGK